MDVPGTRRAWLAAVLALVYPGLGHLYLRLWVRSVVWFGLVAGATFLLLPQVGVGPDPAPGVVLDAATDAWSSTPARSRTVLAGMILVQSVDAFLLAATAGGGDAEACPTCGEALDDDVEFCPWCAEPLE